MFAFLYSSHIKPRMSHCKDATVLGDIYLRAISIFALPLHPKQTSNYDSLRNIFVSCSIASLENHQCHSNSILDRSPKRYIPGHLVCLTSDNFSFCCVHINSGIENKLGNSP